MEKFKNEDPKNEDKRIKKERIAVFISLAIAIACCILYAVFFDNDVVQIVAGTIFLVTLSFVLVMSGIATHRYHKALKELDDALKEFDKTLRENEKKLY